MPDNENSTVDAAAQMQEKLSRIAGTGAVQRVEIPLPKDQNSINPNNQSVSTQQADNQNNEGANATSDANNGAAAASATASPAPTVITDETLREYFKTQGIEYEGVDKLKEKLNAKPETSPTPEQLSEQAKAREKRIVDKFVSGGGTVEQYVAMKSVAEADLAELSKNTLKAELKQAKFTDEEIDRIIKDRYYQIADEDLEQEDDETDKEFKKRSKEYFATKLANRSSHIKSQAAGILTDLQRVIESEDLQAKNELQLSSNIEEQFKKISRKDTYEIGEIKGKAIPPVESEVPESELAEAFKMLTDPVKRKQFFENQDGSVNYTEISKLIAENAKLKAAVKVSYHEGSTRTNAHWSKTFGAGSPHELGIGGMTQNNQPANNGKKVPASVGKVQRVMPGQR